MHHDQCIARDVFAGHEPSAFRRVPASAEAEAMALSKRVKGDSSVFAEHRAVFVFDAARPPGQVAGEKVAKGPLANEADAGAVFARVDR